MERERIKGTVKGRSKDRQCIRKWETGHGGARPRRPVTDSPGQAGDSAIEQKSAMERKIKMRSEAEAMEREWDTDRARGRRTVSNWG